MSGVRADEGWIRRPVEVYSRAGLRHNNKRKFGVYQTNLASARLLGIRKEEKLEAIDYEPCEVPALGVKQRVPSWGFGARSPPASQSADSVNVLSYRPLRSAGRSGLGAAGAGLGVGARRGRRRLSIGVGWGGRG